MTDEEKGKAKWWDRMIPHIVTNRQIIALLRLGTLLGKVSDEEIRAHYDANKTILTLASDFYETGNPVENQSEWEKVIFGDVSMAQAGCGIIATYNARMALGETLTGQDMAELIGIYEKSGAVCGGKFGLMPTAPYVYFKNRGYDAGMTARTKPEDINAIGETYDTVILCSFNNRDKVTDGMHIVNISKKANGYVCHNGYNETPAGSGIWRAGDTADSLWEAARMLAGGNARPVCTIGINRKEEISDRNIHALTRDF